MNADINETIAAIATPLGQSGLGLVKMCGKDALKILNVVFRSKNRIDPASADSHTIHYGYIMDTTNGSLPVDEVLVSIMRAPRTYTKEDTVEISCHGNYVILQKILSIVIKAGARLAEPGEFTKRAFLNGRIDLTQAEAVIDIINAKTEEASKLAIKHLDGQLSTFINNTQDILKEILTRFEINIDFSEDMNIEIDYVDISERLLNTLNSLKRLINTYNQGKILKDGISVAIIGRTNTGKSSLFNKLINSPSRALVARIPGTTRDFIEESVIIQGRLFKFIDTAGFKKPRGILESQSIEATKRCIKEVSIVLFLLDGSKTLTKNDLDIWNLISDKKVMVIVNKVDLPIRINNKKLEELFSNGKIFNISCKDCTGIDRIYDELAELSLKISERPSNEELIITSLRHKNILLKTARCIEEAILATKNNLSVEFIASDLRHAIENLQELTGEKITERILDDIFSKFCIGK